MKKISLQELLGKQFKAEGFDVLDLIEIPSQADRMVRIRTLEDALEEFDLKDNRRSVSYLVQLKMRDQLPEGPQLNLNSFLSDDSIESGEQLFSKLTDETFARVSHIPSFDEIKSERESVELPDGKLNVSFLLKNAQLLFDAGEFSLSRNIYQALLKSGEKTSIALFWLGRCFETEGETARAKTHYQESLTYSPTLEAYQHLAAIFIRGQDDQKAAEVLERALNLKDLSSKTRFELHKASGNCWMRSEAPTQAESHYRAALEIDPSADSIRANLGALHLQTGKISEAKRCFQDALASNTHNEKALIGLGTCFLNEGEKRAAHDSFAKALELNLNNPTAVFHLVKCAYEIKSYATAARILSEYTQIAPVNTNLLYSLAGLQFHLGRITEAKETVQNVLELKPDHSGANELSELIAAYGQN